MTPLYDKTEKGREEIATRKYHLSSRLRSLLLMLDGKHDANEILAKFGGIGLHEDSLAELLEQGFIRRVETAVVPSQPISGAARQPLRVAELHAEQEGQGIAAGIAPLAAQSPLGSEGQYHALYSFFSETIKSAIGLRGYALQLKVERAGSIEDFRALRDPYLKAVEKAKGGEMARSLRDRLDRLLDGDDASAASRRAGSHPTEHTS